MAVNFVKSHESYNPNDIIEDEKNEKSLFFSSSKPKFKRRNQSPEPETSHRGAAIPPPATMEYFGPSSSKQSRSYQPPANLEDSISAGLKYLREQVDKGNKHKWTASSDYTDNSWSNFIKFPIYFHKKLNHLSYNRNFVIVKAKNNLKI